MSEKGQGQRTKSGQFRKGRSGNPKGRPRKSVVAKGSASACDVIIDQTLLVTQNGAPREISVEEALQHKTYQQAISGVRAAQREIIKMILKREKALAKRAPSRRPTVESRIEPDPENANDALVILGVARRWACGLEDNHDRLKLEPWAVQAALRRRRGGTKLTENEISEIKRTTWEPETLNWPRGTGT